MSTVLAVNCGSSSLKLGLYETSAAPRPLCSGEAGEIGGAGGSFQLAGAASAPQDFPTHETALNFALDQMAQRGFPAPDAAGHRIVHGGPKLRHHQRLTPAVLDQIRAAAVFAPLHSPAAIRSIEAISARLPAVPQVVCFDTAFHRTLPDVSRLFALPRALEELGVFRYGFHGLSLESILAALEPVPDRLVIAHLGNGCSVTAILNGQSIDTSMGLTPTGGCMMGTRSGDLDPGVLLYLLRSGYCTPAQLEHLVDNQSGLLGVSGLSSDVRALLKARDNDPNAALALQMFCYQVAQTIARMMVALGDRDRGIDRLIFAGGIGENASSLRDDIRLKLTCLGLAADQVSVVKADEDLRIAVLTKQLLQLS